MTISELTAHAESILTEVERAVVGKREALELVLLGILADGHVLLEDFPGLAKTLIARSFAHVTGMTFSRVQFTPDLMPADVTGSSIYNQQRSDFEFRPGPIFANVLLSDEINRAPPKTQAALLEAMQERQVTTEGETRQLEPPFIVLATQNPIEFEGTYPLPEAQLDRFMLRIGVGYPSREHEWEMLERRIERAEDEVELYQVVNRQSVLEMQRAVEQVHIEESLGYYIVDLTVGYEDRPRRAGRCEPAWVPRAAQALALPRRTGRARLRDARRRQGSCGACTRAPALAEAGALGRAPPLGRHRPRRARQRPDAVGRAGGSARPRAMTGVATGKLRVYVFLAGLGLLAALALGRPELAALAAPFALFAGLGLALMRPVEVRAPSELDLERQLEERTVTLLMEVSANRAVEHLELVFDADEGLVAEAPNPILIHLSPGERRELEVPIRCAHWGTYEVGSVVWRARDPFGLFVYEGTIASGHRLKVYPRGETLQRLLRPLETQAFSGNQVARSRGEGIEFADLRPFTYGDQVRRVNWRATARRGEPWVNETHPERNSDIVIFLDTFAEARRPDLGTLDIGVRAAASLAALYLREKDRVGLVSFGGVLNWLTVTSGTAQLYRIVDSLLDSEILLSYAWKDLDVIPPRTLPPRALVFAFSPLLDERAVGALLDLRARGFDLAVIELSPYSFVPEGETELEQLAYRLWRLQRDALRTKYASLGVPIVEWREGVPMEAVVEEVRAFRRHARVVRA